MKKYLSIMFIAVVAILVLSSCESNIENKAKKYVKEITSALSKEYNTKIEDYNISTKTYSNDTFNVCVIDFTAKGGMFEKEIELVYVTEDNNKDQTIAYYLSEISPFEERISEFETLHQNFGITLTESELLTFAVPATQLVKYGDAFHKELNP